MTLPAPAQDLILAHDLQPHPEGGWYRETWRSDLTLATPLGPRPAGTSILFLVGGAHVSRLHRLRQDEVWTHHVGPGLTLHRLAPDGTHDPVRLGQGHALQAVVPGGWWQGAEAAGGWALVGCVCTPGFSFEDLELGDAGSLLPFFSQHADLVRRLI